ncbi:MAG TPA: hypothetical protein VME18_13730 [Acidobacteriaceae bacterium]|nr:hypothetical protein [Acidobacteriaceae bacterium]
MSASPEAVASSAPRRGWSWRLFSLPVVLGLLVIFVLMWAGSSQGIADSDIWWHLRNAAELVRGGHFAHADSWTFTVAGKPWIDFEWLAELGYYGAWRWLGDRGLYLAMMLVAAAILAGVYGLAWLRSRDWLAAFLVALIAIHFFIVSLAPRTILFGWLFLVVELAILWGLEQGRDQTRWLPLLFLIWINTHGTWFIGFVLMVLFFACGWVQGEWGRLYVRRWTQAQKRRFLLVTAASSAALFANPYGWRLVVYPVAAVFRHRLGTQYIAEWASLDFHAPPGKAVLAVVLGFAILELMRLRRWSLQDLVFALVAVYAAFAYVRFVFMAGILLLPMLAMDLKLPPAAKADGRTKDFRWASVIAMALLLALIGTQIPSSQQLQAGIARDFPENALPYVRSLAGRGNLFNEYEWGGYLEWKAPEVKTFIDPRADIFAETGVMDDYARAMDAEDTFAILDRYHIRFALLAKGDAMAYLLEHSAGWRVAWEDKQAVVFERVR